jgi:hypothetical protein
LKIVGGIGTIGISDVVLRRVVIFTTFDGKMQLPNIFEMGRVLDDFPG